MICPDCHNSMNEQNGVGLTIYICPICSRKVTDYFIPVLKPKEEAL